MCGFSSRPGRTGVWIVQHLFNAPLKAPHSIRDAPLTRSERRPGAATHYPTSA
jgi:hypothetical protein